MSRNMVRAAIARRRHAHYFKDVSLLTELDVYMVCELWQVDDHSGATQHAIKKLLLPGQRGGGKDRARDLREARDTIDRRLELLDAQANLLVRYTGDGALDKESNDAQNRNQNVAFSKSLAYRLLTSAHGFIGSIFGSHRPTGDRRQRQ